LFGVYVVPARAPMQHGCWRSATTTISPEAFLGAARARCLSCHAATFSSAATRKRRKQMLPRQLISVSHVRRGHSSKDRCRGTAAFWRYATRFIAAQEHEGRLVRPLEKGSIRTAAERQPQNSDATVPGSLWFSRPTDWRAASLVSRSSRLVAGLQHR
jgi:hypothetical protein